MSNSKRGMKTQTSKSKPSLDTKSPTSLEVPAKRGKFKRYIQDSFAADLKAGFITAVVALPLAIAFAIASGVEPVMGLYTAIIAGILGSAIGGSRFSITGPTGAMAVIILSTVNKFGLEGLLLAGLLAGLMQIGFGILRLGKVVKYIPLPVISGFTSGIGVIILLGQIPNFLGITIEPQEHIWNTLFEIIKNLSGTNWIAISISVMTIIGLWLLPRVLVKAKKFHLHVIPPSMVLLVISTSLAYFLSLSIPLVGLIPSALPKLHAPLLNWSLLIAVLPAAFTIAMLGAIEALLCAVVADAMTSTKHDSNKELVAQGIANTVVPLFGGIASTAAIARTAVNIREGAKTRMAGIYHAIVLLCMLAFLGPLAMFIPKAFLGGILIFVSFKMINFGEAKTIYRISKLDTVVFFATFALTVVTDLVFAVQIGMLFSFVLLFIRLVDFIDVSNMEEYDANAGINKLVNNNPKLKPLVSIYTLHGPFFFGAMNVFEKKIDEQMAISRKHIILRFKHVPFIDSTGMERLKSFIRIRNKHHQLVYISTPHKKVSKMFQEDEEIQELLKGKVFERTSEAVKYIEANI